KHAFRTRTGIRREFSSGRRIQDGAVFGRGAERIGQGGLGQRSLVRMTGRWRTRIGIQIGERHIRAVVGQKRGSGWVTVRQAADALPGGIVRGGEGLQPNLLGLRLKAMLRENGIRAGRVSVFLEDLPLFVRRFTFPPMTKSELAKAVE